MIEKYDKKYDAYWYLVDMKIAIFLLKKIMTT